MATQHVIDPRTLDSEALAVRGEVFSGVVTTVLGDGVRSDVMVEHDGGASLARRAASCLLVPMARDRVLLARVEGQAFVLAVLEREEGTAHELAIPADLHVRARGSIRLEAGEDLRLRGANALSVAAKTLAIAAERSSWVSEHVQVLAQHLALDADRLRQVATFSERIAESAKETLGSSFREIREAEHVTGGTVTMSLRGMLRAHAEAAVVTAKKLVKLNGDQIHLG
jgi:hypothetical protein